MQEQDLRIYIVITDHDTRRDVIIKGSFDVLRAFLLGVGNVDVESFPPERDCPPLNETVPTKRKPKPTTPQTIP